MELHRTHIIWHIGSVSQSQQSAKDSIEFFRINTNTKQYRVHIHTNIIPVVGAMCLKYNVMICNCFPSRQSRWVVALSGWNFRWSVFGWFLGCAVILSSECLLERGRSLSCFQFNFALQHSPEQTIQIHIHTIYKNSDTNISSMWFWSRILFACAMRKVYVALCSQIMSFWQRTLRPSKPTHLRILYASFSGHNTKKENDVEKGKTDIGKGCNNIYIYEKNRSRSWVESDIYKAFFVEIIVWTGLLTMVFCLCLLFFPFKC